MKIKVLSHSNNDQLQVQNFNQYQAVNGQMQGQAARLESGQQNQPKKRQRKAEKQNQLNQTMKLPTLSG